MKTTRLLASASLLSLFVAVGCASTSRESITPLAIDAIVQRNLGNDFHGIVLVKNGRKQRPVVRTYGTANFETNAKTTPRTRYQIGSISKWVTSVAVLQLVERGRLSLDLPIGAYLPELRPETGSRVTLRHLLSNRSGIPNGVMQEFRKDKSIADLQLSAIDAAIRFGNGEPTVAPGTSFEYSPTNWVIVAAIVERVTGRPFTRAIEERVFAPAALRDTGFADASFVAHGDAAAAYTAALPRTRKMSPVPSFAAASGSMFSTAADLTRLAEAVYGGSLLSREMLDELSLVQVAEERYALGGRVHRQTLGGRERAIAWESGVNGGFKTLLVHVVGEGTTVVILNNTDVPQSAQATAAEEILRTLAR